jgi:hypothetical protein
LKALSNRKIRADFESASPFMYRESASVSTQKKFKSVSALKLKIEEALTKRYLWVQNI